MQIKMFLVTIWCGEPQLVKNDSRAMGEKGGAGRVHRLHLKKIFLL